MQAEFARQLITERKVYSASLRDVLGRLIITRRRADYEAEQVTEMAASRAVRATRSFVEAIMARGSETK